MEQNRQVDAGLSHPVARPTLLAGLILLLTAALVAGRLPPVPQWRLSIWFVVVATAADFALVTARRPGRLSRASLALILGGSLISLLVVLADRDRLVVISFYALSYLTLVGSLLIMRGHPYPGALVAAAMLAGTCYLGVDTGASTTAILGRLAQPLVTVAAFTLVHLIARSIEGGRSRAVAQQLEALAQTDAVRSRNASEHLALSEIPALARPVLERLAAGEPLTPAFRAEIVAADEAVRSHIRRDVPYHAGFLGAIDAARARGVSVQLIGNEDPEPGRMTTNLAEALIRKLGNEDLSAVTIRFLPHSRGGFVTLLLEGSQGAQRFEFEADGSPRRPPDRLSPPAE